MIKCVIIDDEQAAINVLEKYIKKIDNLQLIGTATDPVTGLEIVKDKKPDVVFLDIQMDEMNGIDLMNRLDPSVQVIFCTAYSEFAVQSYELNAIDYLMKPVSFDRFTKAVQRIRINGKEQMNIPEKDIPNDYIFVKAETKGKMIRINIDEIDYIEGRNNYIAIHKGSQTTTVYSTMKEMENYLSPANFMRIHKSFIIALSKIAHIENGSVSLKNQTKEIPIGQIYKKDFLNKINNKLLF